MSRPALRGAIAVLVLALSLLPAYAQQAKPKPAPSPAQPKPNPAQAAAVVPDLGPYLQSELQTIGLQRAEARALLQRGDAVGTALIESFIAAHELQAASLRQVGAKYGQTGGVQPPPPPRKVGSLSQVLTGERLLYQKAITDYRRLLGQAKTPDLRMVAVTGLDGAERHYGILNAAVNSASASKGNMADLSAAIMNLHLAAVADLNEQAAQLSHLGDFTLSNALLTSAQQHTKRAQAWARLVHNYGASPTASRRPLPPVVALPTRQLIIASIQGVNTEFSALDALMLAGHITAPVRAQVDMDTGIAIHGLAVANAAAAATLKPPVS